MGSASGPNFDPITGLPIQVQGANASRKITPGSNPVPEAPASDTLGGTVPTASNSPAPPPTTITPTTPPPLQGATLLEQVVGRVIAVDNFGKEFGLSRNARRLLLSDLDERHPLT